MRPVTVALVALTALVLALAVALGLVASRSPATVTQTVATTVTIRETAAPTTVTVTTPTTVTVTVTPPMLYDPRLALEGLMLFNRTGCVNCHSMRSLGIRGGAVGPDLSAVLLEPPEGTSLARFYRENGLANPASDPERAAQLLARYLADPPNYTLPPMYEATMHVKQAFGEDWARRYVPVAVEMLKMAYAKYAESQPGRPQVKYDERAAVAGLNFFMQPGCIPCHSIRSLGIKGGIAGPDLSDVLLSPPATTSLARFYRENGLTNPASDPVRAAQLLARYLTSPPDYAGLMVEVVEGYKFIVGNDTWTGRYVPAYLELIKMAQAHSGR